MADAIRSLKDVCQPKFDLGNVFVTKDVEKLIRENEFNLHVYLSRLVMCDYGEVNFEQEWVNECNLAKNGTLQAVYRLDNVTEQGAVELWIKVDLQRHTTVVSLPVEG